MQNMHDLLVGTLSIGIPSSRKICLNMCQGNSENSDGCSYLLRMCFIHGTKVSVSQSWISLQVVDREQCVECANHSSANQNTVHLKTGFIWKFSQEWLLWTREPRHARFLKYGNFYFSVAFIFFLAIFPVFQYINLQKSWRNMSGTFSKDI